MNVSHPFFASSPMAMEPLLAGELRGLGAENVSETRAGVFFSGCLETAYRVCLWSRLASRVLLPLAEFPVAGPEDLYRGVRGIDWAEHLAPDGSLAVGFAARQSEAVKNSHFGALKVKDAIVDQMREAFGQRPEIDLERPDVRVNLFLNQSVARISLDLSGESLHRRGYRSLGAAAPLKENLAAAILLRAGWPQIVREGGALIDPMCGSGTLLIEAAMMAADWAPGLCRDYFGFLRWRKHVPAIWSALLEEAKRRRDAGLRAAPSITGYDISRSSVAAALENIERAGLKGRVHVERKSVHHVEPPKGQTGLVVVNPPYGERLGDEAEAARLYGEFGEVLKSRFLGWHVAMIVGNAELGFRVGIRSRKPVTFYNGALECKLLRFDVDPAAFFIPKPWPSDDALQQRIQAPRPGAQVQRDAPGPGAEMLANRLRKNLKNLGRWARKSGVACYRLYDADLPEYAFAIDIYQGEKSWAVVQEYEAPKSIDPGKAEARLCDALATVPAVLEIPEEQMFLKIRRRQKSTSQYQKQAESGRFFEVAENNCRFWVNFEDYLDTGLFLDHRITRGLIRDLAKGKSFLNLFAYTGSGTVYAAVGGATSTTTVDLSATYLDWARKNLALNGIQGQSHALIRADCLEWLEQAVSPPAAKRRRYGLIFLDPPTFSNSKRMPGIFDIQRDHAALIRRTASLLEPSGVLLFSTNCRQFKMDKAALGDLKLEDISAQTIPPDFARNPKIHHCWKIGL